ncbi:MAG: fructosamine kinase family protein [Gallionella sp.]|nr:fructosamine kinase family protein [Gallionella sp.]
MRSELQTIIASAIRDATLRPFDIVRITPINGGSINQAYRLDGRDGTSCFVKLNDEQHLAIFVAEAAGLAAIAATDTLRVPQAITHGIAHRQSYLVLEHLALTSRGDTRSLGTRLAALHRNSAPQFGLAQDNFIGTTAQPNAWADDWITFWREQRLGFQLGLAAKNGYGGELQQLGARLLDALPAFFDNHTPQPSLLHGDLWSGNHAYLADGTPTIFDPASYYGDRECDIAMTELFGGFPATFYDAYRTAWPLEKGFENRRDIYNLYHILNHANLFGGGYVRQAERMMKRLSGVIR